MDSKIGLFTIASFLVTSTWIPFAEALPGQCVDKFEVYRNHTMCLGNPSQTLSETDRLEIETKVNDVRIAVSPAALKMMEVGYAVALEREAQTWADACKLDHDEPYLRFMPGRYHVGQNIYESATNISWSQVFDNWIKENTTFMYKGQNDKAKVGNYTQLVYEDTVLVGCGRQQCGSKYFYVCNFAPALPDADISEPYAEGDSNMGCQSHFSNTTQSLCSCLGKFCTNGGTFDMATCNCTCVPGVQTYDTHICELNCTKDGDAAVCKSKTEVDCKTDLMVPFQCPWLCKVCPWGGKGYRMNSVPMPWVTTTTTTPTTPAGPTPGPSITTGAATGGPTQGQTSQAGGTPGGASKQRGAAAGLQAPVLLTVGLYLAGVAFRLM